MLMPKTASHLDYPAEPWEDKVGLSREFGNVQTESEAHIVDNAPNGHFGRCIAAADTPHVLGPVLGCQPVGHTARSRGRSAMSFSRFPSTMILTRLAESS